MENFDRIWTSKTWIKLAALLESNSSPNVLSQSDFKEYLLVFTKINTKLLTLFMVPNFLDRVKSLDFSGIPYEKQQKFKASWKLLDEEYFLGLSSIVSHLVIEYSHGNSQVPSRTSGNPIGMFDDSVVEKSNLSYLSGGY